MSDDEDYMSDKFLLGTEKYSAPSLVRRAADQRELELLKRRAEVEARMKDKNKSAKVIEQESREKGLACAISSDNKGFKLLEKMGYTPGQGIGKEKSGISEPISIDLKTDRLGLGRAPKTRRTALKKSRAEPVLNTDDFRGRIAQKKSEQLIEIDLRKCQKCCEQLDSQHSVADPCETWFWPVVEKNEESESEEEEEEDDVEPDTIPASEKLAIINKYLRDKYFYCMWCGAAYDDDEDLRDNCPGSTRDDH